MVQMIPGAAYGVALNDRMLLTQRSDDFALPPYGAPPVGPVLYIKPGTCLSTGGAAIPLPRELDEIEAAATVALLFARDLTRAQPHQVADAIGAVCLALDVSEPHESYYRPAIRERCRDGFLPLGGFSAKPERLGEVVTEIGGDEAHRWSMDRLHRSIDELCAEISGFMTLRAGDLLLIGLAADAPRARSGQTIVVRMDGLPTLRTFVSPEVRL
jgi:5-oxopent-3-ene-1,2,5-tricarboxylate decarboxylase/2-hydroxyhepta-2,4-diene-1,7-dioate isomerase